MSAICEPPADNPFFLQLLKKIHQNNTTTLTYVNRGPAGVFLCASGSRRILRNQRAFLVKRGFGPDMFNLMPPIGAQKIKTQAVRRRVNLILKPLPKD